ncbi:ClpP/crotonase [Microthyrium microscopicum]|uniref:Propionyl-CoA carboxylase beta chain, mitochondrial n=1 Tax=Microthyrium microscopicum TaxID=703497 RepID=A0A6A6UFD6_9PEZI|nr:ClpP/crotonase [Microthyrium microscopicum]
MPDDSNGSPSASKSKEIASESQSQSPAPPPSTPATIEATNAAEPSQLTSTINERLSQVASHVSPSAKPNTSRPRRRSRRKSSSDDLPADYSDILSHVAKLREIAATPDHSNRGYQRQLAAGKLWVRERVEKFVDPGSFKEVGSVSGTVTWKKTGDGREEPVAFIPSNNVQGFGKLNGRTIVFTADDFSIRAGHADGSLAAKTMHMEEMSLSLKLPTIKLVDGSSGGGSVTTIISTGWSYLPTVRTFVTVSKALNEGIPNLGAVLGPAIGLGAARVTACHFSVMAANVGSLFNAGPAVVAGSTFEEGLTLQELGGPDIHCRNGTIDNKAQNEEEAFEQLRTVLGFLPNHGGELPPQLLNDDSPTRKSPNLRSIIPRRRERMYDARKIITTVTDTDSWFEIGALWGQTAIVGLARLGGFPIGVISLDPEVGAGAIDALGSQKVTRHLKFCDIFNLPIIQFIDCPGYAIGTVAERTATMRHGINLALAYHGTTTPIASIITRRCYGVAGGIMVGSRDPRFVVAWPSGVWGSLPLEGGIQVGHSYELSQIEKTRGTQAMKERYRELEEEYTRLMNPVRTANNFGVEEIIDPAETRTICAEWLRHMYKVLLPQRVMDRAAGRISPVFY